MVETRVYLVGNRLYTIGVSTADPDDLEVKWLLNVAHMLLGTYPASVPKEHLLGPELFASEHPMP